MEIVSIFINRESLSTKMLTLLSHNHLIFNSCNNPPNQSPRRDFCKFDFAKQVAVHQNIFSTKSNRINTMPEKSDQQQKAKWAEKWIPSPEPGTRAQGPPAAGPRGAAATRWRRAGLTSACGHGSTPGQRSVLVWGPGGIISSRNDCRND